ncbi:universal stress protein [Halomonas sp. CH40]
MFAHVLIGVDFSAAWPVLQQRLMRLRGKGVNTITLASIISPKEIANPTLSDRQQLQQRLENEAQPFRDIGLAVTCLIDAGKPSECLAAMAVAQQADVILCGSKGSGGFTERLLGSTIQRLSHLSQTPLWMEPINAAYELRHGYTTLILATDVSSSAVPAERLFEQLAEHFRNRVALISEALLYADGRGREVAELHLIALATRIPKLDSVIVSGQARKALIDEAKRWEADLLIIGQQGHSRFKERLLGNTAEALLEGIDCPVLVVPHP